MLENPDQPLPKGLFNSLTALDLHSNLLRGPIPILPPRAGFLDFSHNKMTSIFPIDDVVSYLNGSVYFSVSNNSLAGRIPPSICYAIDIVFLDLSNNRFNGLIPQCLGSLTEMTTLDLSGNSIEGEVPKALANCTNLEVLDLGNNKLTGSFPCWLGELPELRILVLASNKLDGPINYTGLNTFPKLHVIDLSSNSFTGDLPSELFMTWKALMTTDNAQADYQQQRFGFEFAQRGFVFYQDFVTLTVKGLRMEHAKILTVFTSVDLSNNLFDGEVPEVIGKLIALHALNLSHNALTGSIPSSLGNLKQLESLDLSKNKLHGAIPTELSDLMFLQVLNLSFNSLAGRIPTGRQLQTFTEDFFQGNNLLCGPPMSKMCAEDDVPSTTDDNDSCNSLLKDCQKGGKFNWQLTSVTLGYGAGIGSAFCMATFWRPWNQLCSTIIKRILN